jgi:hypothetical protein
MSCRGVKHIFVTLNGSDGTFNLPKPINVANSLIALTEISGTMCPRLKKGSIYMCCNMVKWSLCEIAGNSEDLSYLPIISRINHRNSKMNGKLTSTVRCADMPKKAFFIECDSQQIESIHLYLIDETGRRPSFDSCELNCTLTLRDINSIS